MKPTFFDVVVAKDYETNNNGTIEKKTAWYKVGTAWRAKSSDSLNLELYLFPGQRYFINLKEREEAQDFSTFEEPSF